MNIAGAYSHAADRWVQRFRAVIAAGPRNNAVIMVPFDPDEAWGAKADHPVSGTVGSTWNPNALHVLLVLLHSQSITELLRQGFCLS